MNERLRVLRWNVTVWKILQKGLQILYNNEEVKHFYSRPIVDTDCLVLLFRRAQLGGGRSVSVTHVDPKVYGSIQEESDVQQSTSGFYFLFLTLLSSKYRRENFII